MIRAQEEGLAEAAAVGALHRQQAVAVAFYRGSNWWDSKIPPILAIAYVQMLLMPTARDHAVGALTALLVSAFSLAAYAHVLNDLFDLNADRLAGKENRLAPLRGWQRACLLLALAGIGFVPWLVINLDPVSAGLLVVIYTLPVAYAAPPLRLKERGLWGAVADATLVHMVPVLFVVALFASVAGSSALASPLAFAVAGAWAFCVGMRGILLHQIADRQHDLAANLTTFVVESGVDRARWYVRNLVFPVEVLTFGALGLGLLLQAPALVLALVLIVAIDLARYSLPGMPRFDPATVSEGTDIPLHDVYEVWLPVFAASLLAVRDPWFLLLFAAHIVLFRGSIASRALDVWNAVLRLPGRLHGRHTRALLTRVRKS